ncbi:hypothetical protein ACP3TJ_10420 [Desulforudis sp. 1088]|uniref:hypothetical protein n=1 Tax=unclassified Candidatus Desulforudis TaxID=2635950 RepID=UPI003CE583CA
MRSRISHDFKVLEGLLNWYFGPQVRFTYQYRPDTPGLVTPSVFIDGRLVFRGALEADDLVKHLEGLGLKRLDLKDPG